MENSVKKTTKKSASKTAVECEKTPAKKTAKKSTLKVLSVEKKKRILYVASECAPFIATGGLADVAGSLPKALVKNCDMEVSVILPLYSKISDEYRAKMTFVTNFNVSLSWRTLYCGIFKLEKDGVTYYFVDNEYYFKRDAGIYGYYDDGERFAYFSKAVCETIKNLSLFPDVLNVNDWQTALCIIYLRALYSGDSRFNDIRTVFTIHNIEYQGKYSADILGDLFGLPVSVYPTIEFGGGINLMKGAIEMADAVNTVSPTYAEEIKDAFFAHGLESVILRNSFKVRGILNGIDVDGYNPETDKRLFANYSANDLSGKAVCKENLQKLLRLPVKKNVPIIAVISRLVAHKGVDLIKTVIEEFLTDDVQFVVLGTGDTAYESFFENLHRTYPTKCAAIIEFNGDLSRKIYSGSDIFLMPSKQEPCGLSQMIASRYGTVPIVRETGGLNDSIKAYTGEAGNGFTFHNYNAHDMLYVLRQAVRLYNDKEKFEDLVKRCMEVDFSWSVSAGKYAEMYNYVCSFFK